MMRFLPVLLLAGCGSPSMRAETGDVSVETRHQRTLVHVQRRLVAEIRGEHPRTIHAGDRIVRLDVTGPIQVEIPGRKTMALFPGLEFLEGDEFSSSDRDAHGPLADRRRPEPWKITVPLMAVEADGALVAILWKGERKAFFETREKNVMALEDEGSAIVLVEKGATIYDAVPRWIKAFGLPAPEPWPRTLEEELALCKAGFASVSAGGGKHRHCAGREWPAEWSPGFGVLRHLLGEKVEWDDYPDLLSTANCHVLRWEAPFHAGQPERVLKVLPRIRLLVESHEGGEWGFHPMDPKQRTLGKAGDKVLGTSADKIYSIAKAARMTGEADLKTFALEALGKLRRHRVPRGGQAWECPLYEPDLLAAAFAMAAFVEGYKLSGDAALLGEAVRWAKAGLPFLYHWSLPGRKGMLYASIPVFGTTHFTHPWFGVPVQWNGLVYAYYLRKLAPLDASLDWRRIADGITASGVHQQYTEGPSKGCYADGYYDQCTRKAPPDLNPEDLLINILTSIGKDPDPDLTIKK